MLPLTDDVMRQLHEKHPEAQDVKLGSILFGPVEEVHVSLYQQIDGEMIRKWLQAYSYLQILQEIKCELMRCLGNNDQKVMHRVY